jgi:hypothetical protein
VSEKWLVARVFEVSGQKHSAPLVWSFPQAFEAGVCSVEGWFKLVIAMTCEGKWGVEVAAAVFPTGCPNNWVLALLEVISRSCVGLAREKGPGIRKCEGLVDAMGDGRLAAKVICFFIKRMAKKVKSTG